MHRTKILLALAIGVLLLLPPPTAAGDEARWLEKFDRSDPADVYEAIVLAGQRKDPTAAIPLLETAVEKTFVHISRNNRPVRFQHISVACGDALRAIGWPGDDKGAQKVLAKWMRKMLKSKEPGELIGLARALGAWGDPLVDPHLAHLASGRRVPEVQTEALVMSGMLEPTEDEPFKKTREAILKALKGRSDEVKAAACSAAGRRPDPIYVEPLTSLVRSDKGKYAGLFAVWALKTQDYRGGIGTFTHVLGSNPKKTTRQACLKAVTELSRVSDVPELLSMTRQAKKDYRDAAALALGRLVWRGAFGQAVVTGPQNLPTPENVPQEIIDRLTSMVESESDWEVRDAARQGLLRIGQPAAKTIRARLPASIDFSDTDTRETAIELCGIFGAKDAYSKLIKTALHDKSRTIRMFAARALEGIEPAAAAEELGATARRASKKKKPHEYELNAVRALGYVRHPTTIEVLLLLMETHIENQVLMREVEFSLERITGHRFGRKLDRWRTWLKTAKHPLHPMIKKFDRIENRRDAVGKGLYGLSGDTERAVENGLRWLEVQQHDIGFWDGNELGFGGVIGCEPAYTGLSLLAYVGAGYKSYEGKYRETIRRAAEYLVATQFYDGGYPVTGGGDDSWIYAYQIAMGIWGITETYALSGEEMLRDPAQWGIDYLVRVQTPGSGWRYGPRYVQSDTSCTSWVLMTVKAGDLMGLHVAQRSLDGIDSWLERCSYDITGEEELPDDLSTDYDYEVGARRYFKAFTGYFELSGGEKSAAQQTSMTAVGMVCRFFMGWKRSHPYMIGCANYLMDYLPTWMKGLEKGQAIAWYHYFWYYGTLGMHQMGGRYWKAWNDKIKRMYPEKQRRSPAELFGSWDPDTAVLNGGRLFSTAMSILSLETYYRFSPLLGETDVDREAEKEAEKEAGEKE